MQRKSDGGKTIAYLRVSTDDQDLEKNATKFFSLPIRKDLAR